MIISDTHGEHRMLQQALEREKPIDLLIHLGDVVGYEDYIQSMAGCEMEIVKGNSDYRSTQPRDKEIIIENMHVLITHGHVYGVGLYLDKLEAEAFRRGVDIVMFGHTHCPFLSSDRTMTMLNPGSISDPRQKNGLPSYAIMKKEKGKKAEIQIKYLEK